MLLTFINVLSIPALETARRYRKIWRCHGLINMMTVMNIMSQGSRQTFEMLRFIDRRYNGQERPEQDFQANRLRDTIIEVRNDLEGRKESLERYWVL